jgi:molybdate/tungstate transport system ATP-binding protein
MVKVSKLGIQLGECRLRDVSLEVRPGEHLCLMGPTGAGKTVLLECIAGLRSPASGTVRLRGQDATAAPAHTRGVAYVPQDHALFPHMDVGQNIAYGLVERRVAPSETAARIQQVADELGIGQLLRRRPATLSGGEAQRVALARALVLQADLLLLDEPCAAVDERTRAQLLAYLRRTRERSATTVIHVSHSFEEAFAVADRMCIMGGGQVLQTGSPDQVFSQPAGLFVAQFTGAANVLAGEVVPVGDQPYFRCDGLSLPVETAVRGPAHLVARPEDLRLRPGLADVAETGVLRGEVSRLSHTGVACLVHVATGGEEWSVLCPKREVLELGLAAGMAVGLEVPPSTTHVMALDADRGYGEASEGRP